MCMFSFLKNLFIFYQTSDTHQIFQYFWMNLMSLIPFYQKKQQKLDTEAISVCFSTKEFVFARTAEKICFLALISSQSLKFKHYFNSFAGK